MGLDYERFNEAFYYNPDTGVLTWKTIGVGRPKSGKAGYINKRGYCIVGLDHKMYRVHRVAWLLTHGEWPTSTIDHINGDFSDNRLANLRAVSQKENNQNRPLQKNNSSGVMGVYFNKQVGKWHAALSKKHLGFFTDLSEAIVARQQAEKMAGYHINHGRSI